MQDILKEYGPVLITVAVIGALLLIVSLLVGNGKGKDMNSTGVVGHMFGEVFNKMGDQANTFIPGNTQ